VSTATRPRQTALHTITGMLDRSVSGHGCVIGVAGPAGIGKSRLVGEAVALAKSRGFEVFSAFCESHTYEIPFHVAAPGNPFFAEEIARELAERGVLRGEPGAYMMAADVAEVSVPATLQATIAARIDRLDPKAKRTLSAAAVIGSSGRCRTGRLSGGGGRGGGVSPDQPRGGPECGESHLNQMAVDTVYLIRVRCARPETEGKHEAQTAYSKLHGGHRRRRRGARIRRQSPRLRMRDRWRHPPGRHQLTRQRRHVTRFDAQRTRHRQRQRRHGRGGIQQRQARSGSAFELRHLLRQGNRKRHRHADTDDPLGDDANPSTEQLAGHENGRGSDFAQHRCA